MSLVSIAFDTGLRRKLTGKLGTGVKMFAAATAAWTVYAAGFSRTDVLSLTITFLSLMLVLTWCWFSRFILR